MEITKFREWTWEHKNVTYYVRRSADFKLQFVQKYPSGQLAMGEIRGSHVLNEQDARMVVMSRIEKGDWWGLDHAEREELGARFEHLFIEQKLD